uniref:tetraspanin-7 n=1 Tax=Myxine glutinosa TaxID=7769 RepID=UPI00358F6171
MPSRRLQTKPVIGCLKTLLIFYSFVFWVTGLVLLAVGVWGKLSLGPYVDLVAEGNATAPYVLIGTGTTILLFGLFGCLATCKGSPWMLKLYALFLFLVFLVEIVAGISGFVFRHEIKGQFRENLSKAIHSYKGSSQSNTDTAVDDLQKNLHCCGLTNYTDWQETVYGQTYGVPASCCHKPEACPASGLHNSTVVGSLVFQKGCFSLVTGFMESNLAVIAGCAFGIAFSQVFGMILACCLAKHINSNQYEIV